MKTHHYDALDQVRNELALLRTLAMEPRSITLDKHDTIGLYLVLDRLVGKLDAVLKSVDDTLEDASHA
ncbi:MAG: hypothetical protein KAX64_06525 [Chromatiaceae bacterium]|nr:hypothetical protein [Chromatiaceae bacterium]MBP8282352.1 hypothetical protein [Chromatiaceae bacterium]